MQVSCFNLSDSSSDARPPSARYTPNCTGKGNPAPTDQPPTRPPEGVALKEGRRHPARGPHEAFKRSTRRPRAACGAASASTAGAGLMASATSLVVLRTPEGCNAKTNSMDYRLERTVTRARHAQRVASQAHYEPATPREQNARKARTCAAASGPRGSGEWPGGSKPTRGDPKVVHNRKNGRGNKESPKQPQRNRASPNPQKGEAGAQGGSPPKHSEREKREQSPHRSTPQPTRKGAGRMVEWSNVRSAYAQGVLENTYFNCPARQHKNRGKCKLSNNHATLKFNSRYAKCGKKERSVRHIMRRVLRRTIAT